GFGAVWKTNTSDYSPQLLKEMAANINKHF
ncbi:HIT family protein, partial [Neobacillus niacini]